MIEPIVVGGTYRIELIDPILDGVAWDISAATIHLEIRNVAGELLTLAATISGTTAYYDTDINFFNEPGQWTRCWHIVDGIVDLRSRPHRFRVYDAP